MDRTFRPKYSSAPHSTRTHICSLAGEPAELLAASGWRRDVASISHEGKSPQKCARGHTTIFRIVNSGADDASDLVDECGRQRASRHHQQRVARGRTFLLGTIAAGVIR